MYRKLYELWLKERSSADLQEVPAELYRQITEYVVTIARKGRMLERSTIQADLLRHEESEVQKLAGQLLELRFRKIAEKTLEGGIVPANLLTPEEKEFNEKIKEAYARFKAVTAALRGVVEERREGRNKLVRFARVVPEIVGVDLRRYGPFKPEEIAYIPTDSAETLIKRGAAVEVNTSR